VNDVVLQVSDLNVSYGSTTVVRGIDLTVRRGEKIGIVGESGSGKSTLALAVMGLLGEGGRISGGSVRVLGRDVAELSEKQLNQLRGNTVSLVFQDPLTSLDPVKSIGSQIAEAIRAHNPRMRRSELRARSVDLLASVGVPDPDLRLKQYPHEYSGGMRQRVLIAIAIANDPAVIIADEPTTALDVTTQAQVLDLLSELALSRGIAVVLVSHDMGVVAEFCDRMVVMYAGRAVEQVPTDHLFERVSHPYSIALLDSLPLPGRDRDRELAWIPGSPPVMSRIPTGCSFAPRCVWAADVCREVPPLPLPVTTENPLHVVECHRVHEVRSARETVQGGVR
jgi:oligopeptide/dipeptide ABC transporter ATP-binding protein